MGSKERVWEGDEEEQRKYFGVRGGKMAGTPWAGGQRTGVGPGSCSYVLSVHKDTYVLTYLFQCKFGLIFL